MARRGLNVDHAGDVQDTTTSIVKAQGFLPLTYLSLLELQT
jgi:hypothetical protein